MSQHTLSILPITILSSKLHATNQQTSTKTLEHTFLFKKPHSFFYSSHMSQMTHTNDSVTSYVSKTPKSLIRTILIFIFILLILLITPTITYNCNGRCDDKDVDIEPSVEFTIRNNNNDNEDLAKLHTVALLSHLINKS